MQKYKFKPAVEFIRDFELSKQMSLMIVLAYIFSVAVRFYWVYWAGNYPEFFWNDELMISTNDGYAFAEGARDRIAGFHQDNDLSYFGFSMSILTAWLYKIFPFSFEEILLFMPVYFSSLIVVPIILIAGEFRELRAGFIGALIASAANSYYNRTMAGYYDTDMLNIVLGMFVLWAMIRINVKKDQFCLFYIPAFIMIYNWWYASSFSLNAGFLAIFLFYTLIFERKNLLNYQALILSLIAITYIPMYAQILIILTLIALFIYKKELIDFKYTLIIGALSLALFVAMGGLNPVIFQLKFYIFRNVADSGIVAYKFFNVNQTIQESGIVSSKIFMERISSNVLVFLISFVGYIFLCFKHREFIISLPTLALGFLAHKAGLRFTIYAVGVMGLGFGFFVCHIFKILDLPKLATRISLLIITLLALLPAWQHIKDYKASTVFYNSEVEVLDKLKGIANREDYVVAWWDYGYPIRYYSDVKTLIDGGKHLGNDNYPVSFSLFKDQISSANMARVDVEYTERGYREKFGNKITKILEDYGHKPKNVDDFILSLRFKNFIPPKPTRDIYYYLPDRMMRIFPVVTQFSNIDIKDGKSLGEPFFYIGHYYGNESDGINLGAGIFLAKDWMSFTINDTKIPINTLYTTSYEGEKLSVNSVNFDNNAKLHLIFMKDYGRFLIVDDAILRSSYIQLFVLENYDRDLFEPVILSPATKVYKLKR